MFQNYRKNLYFHHNTVVNTADQTGAKGRWRTVIFQVETDSQNVYAQNNIFFNQAATSGETPNEWTLLEHAGQMHLGKNWISPDWVAWSTNGVPSTGSVTGVGNVVSPASNDPGFIDFAHGDFHLNANSSAVDAGAALQGVPAEQAATKEYAGVGVVKGRAVHGAPDLGAFER